MSGRKRRKSRKQSIISSLNNIETKVFNILKQLRIPFRIQVPVDKYTVDFLVNDKYIIEVYGDFWHCNPTKYSGEYFNRGKRKTAEEIWKRDACRKETFESKGYKFLSLWETEINKHPHIIKKKLKQLFAK
jgi:very-short-patch-repair endonuclease